MRLTRAELAARARRVCTVVGVVGLVAALVVGAAVTVSGAPAAAGPPTLYKFLGYANRSDGFNSEFRADFILRVNSGESPTAMAYTYGLGHSTPDEGVTIPALTTQNYLAGIDQQFTIEKRITNGPFDYLVIALHGDAYWDGISCAQQNGLAGLDVPMIVQVTTASGTVQFNTPQPIHIYHYGDPCAGISRPELAITWDYVWNSIKGTSQDGWGVNISNDANLTEPS
ncbi:MAG: hypothetical protein JOY61_05175, partial [Chloroflexi bacterium]|nr:hypothetical protein [Chloroflexota bacterium]